LSVTGSGQQHGAQVILWMIATLTTSQSPSKKPKPCSRERKCGYGHAGMTGEGLHDEGTSEQASERGGDRCCCCSLFTTTPAATLKAK